MLERTNSRIFTFLLGFSAFAVATAAAIFSVTGLSMLYSGEMIYVAIAMGALEFAKIITASYLYRYWKTTGFGLKTYLTIALLVLMIVTSGGIYGYLTNSYQGATIGLDKINSQSQVLDMRKDNLTAERERLVSDIATLRQERQSTIENRNNEIGANNLATDSASVKYRSWRNNQVYKRYNEELTRIDNSISQYTTQLDSTNVRLSRISSDIADKKIEMIDTGVDVGPLVYMARIFNTTMDTVMKWFTLIIVFVFDPLAVALIIALNSVLVTSRKENEVKVDVTEKNYEIGVDLAEDDYDDEINLDNIDDISWLTPDVEVPEAKPAEQAFDDIQKRIDEQKSKRPRFSKPNPKPVLSPELTKELDDLVGEIEEKPTKDIVVPIEEELQEERVVQEPIKSGDIPKEKIKAAVDKVKHQNEFFDKMRDEKPDPTVEPPKFDTVHEAYVTKKDEGAFEEERKSKKKSPVTEDEIRDYFDDAIRKVKKSNQGVVTRTPFQAGGSVSVDHLQDDPDIDYSIQE